MNNSTLVQTLHWCPFFKPVKKEVHVRLDADIIEWLKAAGKGYQSRINSALREVMLQDFQ
jgi:uncharacterized protein (DUF4415 family)